MEPGFAIETTRTASAGAAAAFALRHLAARAGSYAPGIDERLFFGLSRDTSGVDLVQVARWFATHGAELARRGYRVGVRQVAFRTAAIEAWVAGGDGYRAAVLAVASAAIHPGTDSAGASAVALVSERERGKPVLRMADPWPGAADLGPISPALADGHRQVMHRGLLLDRAGWS